MLTPEEKARALGGDPAALERRLRDAAAGLIAELRPKMRRACFDFAARALTGNGLRLRWQLRRNPEAPISYANQQNSMGFVVVEWINSPLG